MIKTSGGDHIFINSGMKSEIITFMHSGRTGRSKIQRAKEVSKVNNIYCICTHFYPRMC